MIIRPQQWYMNNTAINDFGIIKNKVIWKYSSLIPNNKILLWFIKQSYCLNYLKDNINNLILKDKKFLKDVFSKLEKLEQYKNKAITQTNKNQIINLFKELDKLFIEWYWNNKKQI